MRIRRLLLASGGAIAVGLGVAWLLRARRPARVEARGSPEAAPERAPGMRAPARPSPAPDPVPEAPGAPPAPPAGSAPPRFQRDPTKPGYDAAKLLVLMNDDAPGVFAAEPRDEPWASEREGDIVSLTLPELQDADHDVKLEVECHTATCRVSVHSRRPKLTHELGFYPLSCLANWTVPRWGNSAADGSEVEDPYSDFYLVFGEETRDRDGFLSRRDGTCMQYRDEWRQEALK